MTIDTQYQAQDLLLRLMAWNGEPAGLDALQTEIANLCGPGAILDLPKEPAMLRERMIDIIEDYLDSSSSSR